LHIGIFCIVVVFAIKNEKHNSTMTKTIDFNALLNLSQCILLSIKDMHLQLDLTKISFRFYHAKIKINNIQTNEV